MGNKLPQKGDVVTSHDPILKSWNPLCVWN